MEQKYKNIKKKSCEKFSHELHSNRIKKREPRKSFNREQDIYITNKTDFDAQYKNCIHILNSDIAEVYIHCIGNAINRGINLAIKLQKAHHAFHFESNTSTIELSNDYHPLRDEDDFVVQKRLNSCLHIKIYRQLLPKRLN